MIIELLKKLFYNNKITIYMDISGIFIFPKEVKILI